MLAMLVKQTFMANNINIPTDLDTSGIQFKQGDSRFQPGNVAGLATALFKCSSSYAIHVDAALELSKQFEALIDDVANGIISSWKAWIGTVKFVGVVINGPVGILPPAGMVGGPNMAGPAMLGLCAPYGQLPSGATYAKAITAAIATGFDAWAKGYSHQAIPFPGGAACVGSMPPSPNTPIPLATGASPGEAALGPSALKGLMVANLGTPGSHSNELFDAFAKGFNMEFLQWKGATQIANILGAGGVAPPVGGPVAGAVGNGGMLTGVPPS